ncbi:hypothetical protein Plhal304r1_c035g0109281 [Plasmopara halstedii]
MMYTLYSEDRLLRSTSSCLDSSNGSPATGIITNNSSNAFRNFVMRVTLSIMEATCHRDTVVQSGAIVEIVKGSSRLQGTST